MHSKVKEDKQELFKEEKL